MKFSLTHRSLLKAILSGAYTPLDVREFVQLCYTLALPLIRKKIINGELNLNVLRLKEVDIVYDCLADLFRRDEQGRFIEIESHFRRQSVEPGRAKNDAGEEMLAALRSLIFMKVNKNIIRLYSETDPVLGKVLRNLKLAVEKTKLFREEHRFGEVALVPEGCDPLISLAPIPHELIEQGFMQVVLLHDNMISMVKKLHRILVEQQEHQRVVPLVKAALIFKKVYALGWEDQEKIAFADEPTATSEEIVSLARSVCQKLEKEMRQAYVKTEKVSEELFRKYTLAVNDILVSEFDGQSENVQSYFEQLQRHLPGLSKPTYREKHRKILEYLAKTAKTAMREELKKCSLQAHVDASI